MSFCVYDVSWFYVLLFTNFLVAVVSVCRLYVLNCSVRRHKLVHPSLVSIGKFPLLVFASTANVSLIYFYLLMLPIASGLVVWRSCSFDFDMDARSHTILRFWILDPHKGYKGVSKRICECSSRPSEQESFLQR